MRHIPQVHPLMLLRDAAVKILEDGNKLLYIFLPFPVYFLSFTRHHLFPQSHQFLIGFLFLLKQHVALLQRLVVTHQSFDILSVVLRNHHVHELSPFLTAARNQFRIGRRDHHQRYQSYMFRKPLVFLLISFETLLLPAFQARNTPLRPLPTHAHTPLEA